MALETFQNSGVLVQGRMKSEVNCHLPRSKKELFATKKETKTNQWQSSSYRPEELFTAFRPNPREKVVYKKGLCKERIYMALKVLRTQEHLVPLNSEKPAFHLPPPI